MPSVVLDLRENGTLPAPLLGRLDGIMVRDLALYNAFIADLSKGREHNIDWWVCRPATRNNHVSILYTRCMQLALIRELLSEGMSLTVWVDCPHFAAVVRQMPASQVTVVLRGAWRGRLRMLTARSGHVAASVFHCGASALAAWWTRGGRSRLPDGPICVVNTFVSQQSIVLGEFTDRYFPGLFESLAPDEREKFHYLPIFYRLRHYKRAFRALRAGKAKFLFYEDHLGLGDYAFAFGHWWRSRALAGRGASYASFSVGALVDLDIANGRYGSIVVRALLAYRFHLQAAARGLQIKSVLDWYEGLDLNHAIAAGIQWHTSATKLTGFRSAGSLYYMSCTPTPHEVTCDVVPRTFAVVGTGLAETIQSLCPDLKIVPAPGLRYRALASMRREPQGSTTAILIALPLSERLARDLIETLGRARSLLANPPEHWWIKSHPALPESEVMAALGGALPTGLEFVQGDFYEWLRKSDMVIGVGSSALMESVAMGIPTACMASGNAPTEIPVPQGVDRRLSRVVYDAAETADAVREMIPGTAWPLDRAELHLAMLGSADIQQMRRLAGFGAT